jgi:predicted phage-related endonuclease
MRVYLAKTTDLQDSDDRPELEWGHVMEPVILAWYERETGAKVLPGGQVQHRSLPWLWSTLDAKVIGAPRNVEIKNVASNMGVHWDAYSDDGVPRYVRAQVTIGMACTGATSCDVVASVGGRPPHVWTVPWDPDLGALLIRGAERFWASVVKRQAPTLDGTSASKAYLRARYPSNADRVIVPADEETDAFGKKRIELKRACDEAASEIDRLDAEIMALVGSHDGAEGDGWKMTWKIDKNGVRRQRFTVKGGRGDE